MFKNYYITEAVWFTSVRPTYDKVYNIVIVWLGSLIAHDFRVGFGKIKKNLEGFNGAKKADMAVNFFGFVELTRLLFNKKERVTNCQWL